MKVKVYYELLSGENEHEESFIVDLPEIFVGKLNEETEDQIALELVADNYFMEDKERERFIKEIKEDNFSFVNNSEAVKDIVIIYPYKYVTIEVRGGNVVSVKNDEGIELDEDSYEIVDWDNIGTDKN